MAANGFENLQVTFEIGDEARPEIFGGKFFCLVLLQQPLDSLLIVRFEQLEDFADVFLADEDVALVKLLNDALVSVDEATERGQKRSEEHTSELQSQSNLVCRLLLEKKKP